MFKKILKTYIWVYFLVFALWNNLVSGSWWHNDNAQSFLCSISFCIVRSFKRTPFLNAHLSRNAGTMIQIAVEMTFADMWVKAVDGHVTKTNQALRKVHVRCKNSDTSNKMRYSTVKGTIIKERILDETTFSCLQTKLKIF